MEQQIAPKLRRRINVSRSVKGVYTFEFTVEGDETFAESDLLQMSDSIRRELEKRYPFEEAS